MLQKPNQRKSILGLWLFMALYLLNISVDAPDISNKKEDLSFNDQESIIELVVEKGLGFDNVIIEQDDTDSNEQSQSKKSFSLDYFILPKISLSSKSNIAELKKTHRFWETQIPEQLFYNAISPPPKV